MQDTAATTEWTEHQRRFLDAGLDILADTGVAGLKQAVVCTRVGVSTGPFYYAFGSWSEYRKHLIRYWRAEKSTRLIDLARAVADPHERIHLLVDVGLHLPHATEAAIRVWAGTDPDIRAIQEQVDRERTEVIADAWAAVTGSREHGVHYANAALYVVVGYEAGSVHDPEALAWALESLRQRSYSDAGLVAPPRREHGAGVAAT